MRIIGNSSSTLVYPGKNAANSMAANANANTNTKAADVAAQEKQAESKNQTDETQSSDSTRYSEGLSRRDRNKLHKRTGDLVIRAQDLNMPVVNEIEARKQERIKTTTEAKMKQMEQDVERSQIKEDRRTHMVELGNQKLEYQQEMEKIDTKVADLKQAYEGTEKPSDYRDQLTEYSKQMSYWNGLSTKADGEIAGEAQSIIAQSLAEDKYSPMVKVNQDLKDMLKGLDGEVKSAIMEPVLETLKEMTPEDLMKEDINKALEQEAKKGLAVDESV